MCCLHIVVIFGFVVAHLCDKEDDDVLLTHCCHFWFCHNTASRQKDNNTRFPVSSFFSFFSFWLQRHSI
jgi:hypothetical protein